MTRRFDPHDAMLPGTLATDLMTTEMIAEETGGLITKELLDDLASTGRGPSYVKRGSKRVYSRHLFRLWLIDWIGTAPTSAAEHRVAPPTTKQAARARRRAAEKREAAE